MITSTFVALMLSAPAPSVTQAPSWRDAGIFAASTAAYFALHSRQTPLFDPAWENTERGLSYQEDSVPTETFYAWGAGLGLAAGLEGGSLEAFSPLQTLTLTALSTQLLKYSFGRPRPDYNDRLAIYAETQEAKLLRDSRLSMPSGHASAAYALALHTGLWWHRAACRRGFGQASIAAGYTLPLLSATAISWSRVTDHRHNPSDVLAGALLGLGVSYAVNRIHFGAAGSCASKQ
jgi:membrane-associated phospholipid phosphatase